MKAKQVLALTLAAGAIFAFVALTSRAQAVGGLGETIRELQNTESFRESGGQAASTEARREAEEWQRESTQIAGEIDAEYMEAIEPPHVIEDAREEGSTPTPSQLEGESEMESAVQSLEELMEGPLNTGGGGGGCSYSGGWCPPSCGSCSGPMF